MTTKTDITTNCKLQLHSEIRHISDAKYMGTLCGLLASRDDFSTQCGAGITDATCPTCAWVQVAVNKKAAAEAAREVKRIIALAGPVWAAVPEPEGFAKGDLARGYTDQGGRRSHADDGATVSASLVSDSIRIHCNFSIEENHDRWIDGKLVKGRGERLVATGHTEFKDADGHWLCFSRRGVDDSFYFDPRYSSDGEPTTLAQVIAAELARVAKSLAYAKGNPLVALPGTGLSKRRSEIELLKVALAARGVVRISPAGFGTGYTIQKVTGRRPGYGQQAAPAALCALLGASPLMLTPFDHD